MSAASYIGRVGALAVALGIGTAGGHGLAWADETGTTTHTATHADSPAKPTKPAKKPPKKNKPAPAADNPATDNPATETPKLTAKNKNKPAPVAAATPPKTTPTAATPPKITPAAVTPKAVAKTAKPTAAVPTAAVTPSTPTPIKPPVKVAAAAAAAPNPVLTVAKAVGDVLNWAFNPTPKDPAHPTLAWTLLAFARREIDTLVSTLSPHRATTTTSQPIAAVATASQPSFPTPGQSFSTSTSFVNWVTGNFPPNDTYNRFGVWGTDVGTMWDNGIADDPSTPINEHQVLIAFGDTFSGANMTGTWRNNTLARSSDTNLADGMTIPAGQWLNGNMFGGMPLWQSNYARQIILPERLPSGLPTGVTLIPTAGISVPTPGTQFGATQYLSFMSVKQWGSAGQWSTNYSAIAYSTDNGENWYVAPTSVRQNSSFTGYQNFQQSAFMRPGDGYVYAYGTPNGRGGSAYLSRVAEADILDASKYQYYSKGNGGIFGIGAYKAGWYKDATKATSVFGKDTGACGVAKAGNHVSELSVQYNQTLGKYVTLYCDQFNNVVMRTSDTPQGKWSAANVLMTQQNGGIYAPMLDPWSPSTLGTGTDLYWNLSLWSQYNVMLMKTDLTKV